MRLITIFALLILALANTGCNTMEGMGRDIKKGGHNLEKAAENNK